MTTRVVSLAYQIALGAVAVQKMDIHKNSIFHCVAGWIGIILVIVFCVNAGYGGSRLGACWEILEERYVDYRKPVRNPYATIAYRAVGKWAS